MLVSSVALDLHDRFVPRLLGVEYFRCFLYGHGQLTANLDKWADDAQRRYSIFPGPLVLCEGQTSALRLLPAALRSRWVSRVDGLEQRL